MAKHKFLYDYSGLTITFVEAEVEGDKSTLDVLSPEGDGPADAKKIKLSDDACVRPAQFGKRAVGTAAFWRDNWREKLCKCTACLSVYEQHSVTFLTEYEDTTHCYEEKGKGNEAPSSYMASMEALSTLPRVNQIDAITTYNAMKEKLFEFLQVV